MPAQQPGPAGPGGPGYYDDRGYDDRGYDDRGPADDGRRKGVGWLALAIAGLVLLLLGLLGGCLVGQSMCDDCGEQVTTTVTTSEETEPAPPPADEPAPPPADQPAPPPA
ncbi:MAG TPA: hypothetical protein GX694_07795, partial [Actinomycetales bacterium]|nr:hypothetical protein [Actinomycetales bacterium]